MRMPPREPPKDANPPANAAASVSRGISPSNLNNKQNALRRLSGTGGNDGNLLDAIAAKVAAKLATPPPPPVVLQPLTPLQQEAKALVPVPVGMCWWETIGFNPAKLLLKLVPPPPPEVDAKGKEKKKAAKKGKGKEVEVLEDMQVGGA